MATHNPLNSNSSAFFRHVASSYAAQKELRFENQAAMLVSGKNFKPVQRLFPKIGK